MDRSDDGSTSSMDAPPAGEPAANVLAEAMQAILLERMCAAGPYFAAWFVVLAVTKAWAEPGVTAGLTMLLSAGDLVCAAVVVFAWALVRQGRIAPRSADASMAVIVGFILADIALHSAILGHSVEVESISYMLVLVGIAVFFVDVRWYVSGVLATIATWGVVSLARGAPLGQITSMVGIQIATGCVVSSVLFALQRQTLARAETMRLLADARAGRAEELARELRTRNAEIEAFSYMASHDLRAPLRGMSAHSQAMLDDAAARLTDSDRHHLRKILDEGGRLSDLVQDLMTLSRVGSGTLRREPVDVSRMAREVWDSIRLAHPSRPNELRVEEGIVVDADPGLVRVVLENLLGNAWKYTAKDAPVRVEVGAETTPVGRAIFVRDHGIGFRTAQASEIFRPFHRLPNAAGVEGTGVGLASVQRIVARHGGAIWAIGEPGKGATFWFTLAPPTPPQAPRVSAAPTAPPGRARRRVGRAG